MDRRDWGIELGKKITLLLRVCCSGSRRPPQEPAYQPLPSAEDFNASFELGHSRNTSTSSSSFSPITKKRRPRYTQRLPFRRIFTRNVSLTLVTHSLLAFHVGTFNSLWFVFLSTPAFDPHATGAAAQHLPFKFTGGMGLPPARVGLAMSILGVLGILLQLFVYPSLSARLGTVRCLRVFLPCFPATYFVLPFLSLVPKNGVAMWIAITAVLSCQVVGRTFALPNMTILVNNCSPHPSVLGTLHGLAQSFSSAARTMGPMLCGYLYGIGLARGVVGGVWWGLSGFATMGWIMSWLLREGDGHEIWLDGDEEEDETKEDDVVQKSEPEPARG